MRKVNKSFSVTRQSYITDDKTEFSFEGPAREHEIHHKFQKIQEHGIKSQTALLPFSRRHAVFFFVKNKRDFEEVLAFLSALRCRMNEKDVFAGEMWYGYIEAETDDGKVERISTSLESLKQEYDETTGAFFSLYNC